MAYAETALLKSYLDVGGTADDTLLGLLLDRATEAIDNYTGRVFSVADATTRTYDATRANIDGPVLWLDYDCCGIEEITNGDGATVSDSAYVTEPRNGSHILGIRLKQSSNVMWTYATDWESAISVSGLWGYSETPPADVEQACIRWAAFLYRQRTSQLQDVTAIEAGVVIRPTSVPGDVKAFLAPYRRLS